MLVESCALYAATFLLFLVPWWAGSDIVSTFWPVLIQTQVCDVFILLQRITVFRRRLIVL